MSDSTALLDFFVRQEARTHEPWRVDLERYEHAAASFHSVDNATAQAQAIELAKNQHFAPEEALMLTYTLFSAEVDRHFFAMVLMNKSGFERVQLHNWHVAN